MLRVSAQYQQPPSLWFGGDGSWTEKDRALTLAHEVYKSGLCGDCGRPVDECSSGSYKVETRTCQPTAAVERWRKENKTTPPGVVLTAVKIEHEGGVNPTAASAPDWWKEQNGYNPDGTKKEQTDG